MRRLFLLAVTTTFAAACSTPHPLSHQAESPAPASAPAPASEPTPAGSSRAPAGGFTAAPAQPAASSTRRSMLRDRQPVRTVRLDSHL